MALNFHLFNCDRTFSLDKVEALIQRVAAKLSRETKIEKTNFALPRMKELSEKLEKEDSHFDYAVFVVHAHESRLSINERNAGIGYAKVYRALQKVTDDRVLVVIGGDDNYKDQRERDMSVLSRWAWHKICSQFAEDYVNGVKGFIFSWEENHNPIHEEALEFYLDPTKKGTQFVPRPKPPPAKFPEKKETKKTERPKLLEQKKQEPVSVEARKILEKEMPNHDPLLKKQEPKSMEKQTLKKEFRPEKNESRKLPSDPGNQTMNRQVQPSQQYPTHLYQSKTIESAQGNNTNELLVLPFYSRKESVSKVENLITNVCKEFGISSWPSNPFWHPNSLPQEIIKNKPRYLVLVSEFDEFRAELSSSHNNQIYHDIVKNSKDVGTELIFVITEDCINYREGDMCSDAVHSMFTKLNQNIPSLEQPLVMSWNKTPWTTHKDALVQLLTPYGKVRAVPQQYGATKQDSTSRAPYTQPEDVPMKRRFYRASISYGRVVQVLESDPPGWEPDACDLEDLLKKHGSVKKAAMEFWDQGDGKLQSVVRPCEAKLYKIAEGLGTDDKHSILVYSYHVEEKTNDTVCNFINYVEVPVLLPCQTIEPASLMRDIMSANPDYVMFSADTDVLIDDDEVKKLIQKQGTRIRDIIESNVGEGVIILLFGDKYYKEGEFASEKARQYVRKLAQGIVEPDRLTVMTCHDKPYLKHQDWMKELLKPKNISFEACRDPDKGLLRYTAEVGFGRVDKVSYRFPQDWQPEEFILKDVLEKSKKQEKVTLEFWEGKNGQINPIVTTPSRGRLNILPSISNPFSSISNPFPFFSKGKKKSDKSEVV